MTGASRVAGAVIVSMIALACVLPLTSCASDPSRGYAFGHAYDDSIATVAVPIFGNDTQARGLELMITEALIKEIERRTPWKVTRADGADSTLEGSLNAIDLRQLSQTPGVGLVQEQAVTLTARFQWRDNRTGDVLAGRTRFRASATFAPQSPVSDRIEHAQRQAAQQLARDIVSTLRSGW